MKLVRTLGWMLVATCAFVAPAEAKKVKIKLGTLAPEKSPWYTALARVGQRWQEVSSDIELKIYPGGVVGDEGDMVRKMRIGQLDAATLTNIGMSRITKATVALQVPMMVESYEELDYLRDKLSPQLEAELEKGGFIVLTWGDAGWVHFFSKEPAKTPDDFRKLKMFLWSGDPESEAAWKASDFKPVPMSSTDVLSGLQTGMIEWVGTAPLFALTSQWFGLAKNMVAINWSPLNGATLVTKAEWEKIDPAIRPKLLAIAREEGVRMRAEVRTLGDDAIKAMVERGLVVHTPSAAEVAAFKAAAEKAYPTIRGPLVPAEVFDEAQRLVKEFRAQKGK